MKYITVEAYETECLSPICVSKNERVSIEIEYDEEYPNWFYCNKIDGSNSGWIPAEIIQKENGHSVITEDYSAKELSVEKGFILNVYKELNGWVWCECENTKEIGWVPLKNIKKLDISI